MQHLTFVIAPDNVLLLYCFDHCRCIVVILFWLLLMSYYYTVLVAIDVALLFGVFYSRPALQTGLCWYVILQQL